MEQIQNQNLKEQLQAHQSTLLEKWYNRMIEGYPPEMRNFWEHKERQFTQPMPYSMAQNMKELLRIVLSEAEDRAAAQASLDQVMRICAVQNLAPSAAIRFILLLKEVLWQELQEGFEESGVGERALLEFRRMENRIDELALLAFDQYMNCRQKIYDLRIQELKRGDFALR